MLPNLDPVHKITIIARGMMGGYTQLLPTEDRYLYTRSQFEDTLAWSLGGHAAEQIVFGEMTTGAENDIERATKLARKMVMEYGMSDKLGPLAVRPQGRDGLPGPRPRRAAQLLRGRAEEIDQEVRRLITQATPRPRISWSAIATSSTRSRSG